MLLQTLVFAILAELEHGPSEGMVLSGLVGNIERSYISHLHGNFGVVGYQKAVETLIHENFVERNGLSTHAGSRPEMRYRLTLAGRNQLRSEFAFLDEILIRRRQLPR